MAHDNEELRRLYARMRELEGVVARYDAAMRRAQAEEKAAWRAREAAIEAVAAFSGTMDRNTWRTLRDMADAGVIP